MYDNVNSMIAENIEETFGKLSHRTGKKHTFLGVDIKFIGGKKVTVSTPHHVDEALEYFGETLKGNVLNPATSQLFTITSEPKKLDNEIKGALSLHNCQNIVDHEAFKVRLGNIGVFYMDKGAVLVVAARLRWLSFHGSERVTRS